MALNLANLMYLIRASAFEDKSLNRSIVVNEICVMIVGYLLTGFSDFVLEASMKSRVGKWMITLTLCNVLYNFM